MNKEKTVLTKSLFVNTFLVTVKITVGILSFSTVLIADGIHSLSDLITDILAILGSHLAARPADRNHPYGHGKLEYLISFLIGLVVLVLGCGIIFSAFHFTYQSSSLLVLYTSILVTVIKYLLASYLKKNGIKLQSNILLSSSKESMADALTSLIVVLSFFLSNLEKYWYYFKYTNLITICLIGFFIIKAAYDLLKENILALIGEEEQDLNLNNKIKKDILTQEEILGIKEMHLMKYGFYYQLNLHLYLNADLNLKKVAQITNYLKIKLTKHYKIDYININVIPKEGVVLCQNYLK